MMTNNVGRVPTQAEQIMQEKSRQAALYSDAVNTGIIKEAKEDNIKNNFFRGYNNFRYSHPWAEGLSWTPIIGDGMDLIYLTDAVNNKDYMAAGLGLGMLALPNFIQKPLQKYGKLQNIPDEIWDDLYNKAIKNNNLKEAQQLRDLHFSAKAPQSVINYPVFHNTDSDFNIFDLSKFGKHDSGFFGYGIYVTPDVNYAGLYGPIQKKLYLNVTNPYDGMDLEGFNRAAQRVLENENQLKFKLTQLDNGQLPDDYYLHEPYIKDKSVEGIKEYYKNIYKFNNDNILAQYAKKNPQYVNKDAAISYRVDPYLKNINTGDLPVEIVVPNNTTLKLADAITYDDYGNIIPLSKRDDFTNPDTRYSWLIPTVPFGVMSYNLSKQKEQNQYKKGGKLKSKKNIKKCEKGTTQGGLIKRAAKFIYGLTLPEYKGTFNEAFRQARINGNEKFRWNGELYNTNLKLDEILEALKQWDTKGDLGKEEFKNQAIRNHKAFHDFYSKTYKTNYNNKNFDKLYDAAIFYDRNAQRTTNMELGSMIYSSLIDTWDEDKVAAVMGNTYKETGGWVNLKQNNGPGEGLFQMEQSEQNRYKNWLNENKLTASRANEVMYVKQLFDSKSPLLNTPWTNLDDPYTIYEINNQLKLNNKPLIKNGDEARAFVKTLKSKEEADKYKVGCAWQHQDYSTEEAWHDWEYGNLDAKTKAFEALYEKAGRPDMDERYYMAHLIKKNQHIFK